MWCWGSRQHLLWLKKALPDFLSRMQLWGPFPPLERSGRRPACFWPLRWPIVLVSSLPVSFSVTPLAWKLSGPQWENCLLLQNSKSPLDFWNVPVPSIREGTWVWLELNAFSKYNDCVRVACLGCPTHAGVKLKWKNGLSPRAAALKQLMMTGQKWKKETQIPPPFSQLRTEPMEERDDWM